MADADDIRGGQEPEEMPPLLVKRYASRRLYNTETSDYVTLDDIASAIRSGRDVRIVDLKSGEDLTRQYLLQIIAEHESRGENVLPVTILTDLVRSYASSAQSILPEFLAASFEALRTVALHGEQAEQSSQQAVEPGALRRRQQAFLRAMDTAGPDAAQHAAAGEVAGADNRRDELADIRRQLAKLQERVSKL